MTGTMTSTIVVGESIAISMASEDVVSAFPSIIGMLVDSSARIEGSTSSIAIDGARVFW